MTIYISPLTACWRRDHVERPSFEDILMDIKNLEDSEFFSDLSDQEFLTMQSTWRDEIQKKFVELKKMEHVRERVQGDITVTCIYM